MFFLKLDKISVWLVQPNVHLLWVRYLGNPFDPLIPMAKSHGRMHLLLEFPKQRADVSTIYSSFAPQGWSWGTLGLMTECIRKFSELRSIWKHMWQNVTTWLSFMGFVFHSNSKYKIIWWYSFGKGLQIQQFIFCMQQAKWFLVHKGEIVKDELLLKMGRRNYPSHENLKKVFLLSSICF